MPHNLLQPLPTASAQEHIQRLLSRPGLRVERIVSDAHCSPPGFWYEQTEDEWLLLLQGAATLAYRDGRRVALVAGDSLLLPAGLAHRVESSALRTVWLVLFFPAHKAMPEDPPQ